MFKKLLGTKTLKELLIRVLVCLLVGVVLGVISFVVGWIPLIGWLIKGICWVIDVFCTVCIILSIVGFVKNNM